MTAAFDDRLLRVGITIDGETTTYDERFEIEVQGQDFVSADLSTCEIRIDNISKEKRNYLLTNATPFTLRPRPAVVTVDVGRASFGVFRVFQGNMFAGSPTQPPNIGLTLTSLGLSTLLAFPVSNSFGATAPLKTIAAQVAADLNATLDFQATNINVTNYQFSGSSHKQIQRLIEAGNVQAWLKNGTLHVRDFGAKSRDPILINSSTGLVGVPVVTEQGVSAQVLINREIKPGDFVTIESDINPAANGTFPLFQLFYSISSRKAPFYWQVNASRAPIPPAA